VVSPPALYEACDDSVWQVRVRRNAEFDDWVQQDLGYIDSRLAVVGSYPTVHDTSCASSSSWPALLMPKSRTGDPGALSVG
jgi:hypothetical protein